MQLGSCMRVQLSLSDQCLHILSQSNRGKIDTTKYSWSDEQSVQVENIETNNRSQIDLWINRLMWPGNQHCYSKP